MSPDRTYEGEPIDLTYQHLGERNGETVAGTSDDDKGEVSADTWPDSAPPRETLDDDKVAVIEAAANPGNEWESLQELRRQVVPHRSKHFAGYILRHHYPDGHKQVKDETATKGDLSEQDVREIRRRLLNGEATRDLAEAYKPGPHGISDVAKGNRGPDIDNPPRLDYDRSQHEWYIDDTKDSQTASSDSSDASERESLCSIRGVGRQREIWLKQAGYEDVDDVRQASVEELTEVKGIGERYAKAIKANFGDQSGDWFTVTEYHNRNESDPSKTDSEPDNAGSLSAELGSPVSKEYDKIDTGSGKDTSNLLRTVACGAIAFSIAWVIWRWIREIVAEASGEYTSMEGSS